MELIVNGLNGYLYSLRRLTENKCDFWAELINIDSDIAEVIDSYLLKTNAIEKIIEKKKIDYVGVEKLLDDFIFSNLVIKDENIIKLLVWDIVEYYGLASTVIDSAADFNPLVSKGAIQITVQSSFHKQCVYYIVPISNYAIVTGLAIRF